MTPEERAYAAANLDPEIGPDVRRRLSPWRIVGLLAIIAVAAGLGLFVLLHNIHG